MPKVIIYDKDPVQSKLKELENRIAVLEGGKPLFNGYCKSCEGTGKLKNMIVKDDDEAFNKCHFCNGEGK